MHETRRATIRSAICGCWRIPSGIRLSPFIFSLMVVVWSVIGGCVSIESRRDQVLDPGARWILLPIVNFAEAPQIGERIEAMLDPLLRARGIGDLELHSSRREPGKLPEIDERRRFEAALRWAKTQGHAYCVTGNVTEWQYKGGLEPEPAVGLSLRVLDLETGRVVFSAVGSRTGWGNASLSGTAQELLGEMISLMRLEPR